MILCFRRPTFIVYNFTPHSTANAQCGKHNTPIQTQGTTPHHTVHHYLMFYSFSLCSFVFACSLKGNLYKTSGCLPHFCQATIGCRFHNGSFITICVVDCQLTSVAWHESCQLRFTSFISGLFSLFGL